MMRHQGGVIGVAALAIASAVTVTVVAVAPAQAAPGGLDTDTRVGSWDLAAATLGVSGSLWEPRWTAELDRTSRIRVLADNLAFDASGATAGDTAAVARYGTGKQALTVQEKWANTGWAAEPEESTSSALVGRVPIRLGDPGTRITVRATVSADCFPQPKGGDPVRIPKRFRCTRADVLRYGGTLEMTARPASTMTAPGDATIRLQSRGLTFRQLLRVARSLQQVAGAPIVAGSAQMVAMCRQMVEGRLDFEQATAFAVSLGYVLRLGSVDGAALPVTADYRPDRFTVSVVGGSSGTVTACRFG